jgi:dTDP-glucose pyrophosphorylase
MEAVKNYKDHLITVSASAREALQCLDSLPETRSRALFVIDSNKLVGTLTYGDIRRGLLNNKEISDGVMHYMNTDFKSLVKDDVNPLILREYRKKEYWLLPVLDHDGLVVDVIDLKNKRTVIPAAALIMAGGRGERLRPLTDTLPKPMLLVGGKPIIETNIDRLVKFGIKKIYISVGYLAEKIIEYFGDGRNKGVEIEYIREEEPLGTLGACCMIENLEYDQLIVMNSDILTNIDFEDLYNHFRSKDALMCVASIPYHVNIPYGIMQSNGEQLVDALIEKPSYTYYANAGIYVLHKDLVLSIPKKRFYNATDLMQQLIDNKQRLVHYPILEYWLDIGKYEDFIRAQQDYSHINF